LLPAFPSGDKPVCVDLEWCAELRNYNMVNVVVVRFNLNDLVESKVRFMKARLWINEHNKIFAEMGK
jgi:hypothetical protein